jgi:hypothetical protein
MTWSDVAVAGAFVLGIAAGGLAVIRVFKYALEHLRAPGVDRGEEGRRRFPPREDGGQ